MKLRLKSNVCESLTIIKAMRLVDKYLFSVDNKKYQADVFKINNRDTRMASVDDVVTSVLLILKMLNTSILCFIFDAGQVFAGRERAKKETSE